MQKIKPTFKMKTFWFLLFCILMSCFFACRRQPPKQEAIYRPGTALLEHAYERFREKSLTKRQFKHRDIAPLIRQHAAGGSLRVEELGKSVKQRPVYQLTFGKGAIKVMLWSQMHGDESTATMALFDLFNFLEGENDEFDSLRTLLAEKTTLYFIPMLNPDGAEAFTRRNAYGFDINRDALRAESPEARILKQAREKVLPAFGFNLHDQSIYYNVEGTPNPATISVLAPAFDQEVSMNEIRKESMKVIVGMNELLQKYIPGGVGKYDDSFYPRAFGDNFQKWGTSTILIESGGYKNDPEKQFIRKLNFMVILRALSDIAGGAYQDYEYTRYFDIPDNDNKLTDLLIRNITIEREGQRYQTDISVRQGNSSLTGDASSIADLGDLSILHGYEELDASGFRWQPGRLYGQTYASAAEIDREEAFALLRKGYLAVRVTSPAAADENNRKNPLPLLIVREKAGLPEYPLIGKKASFFISKDGRLRYAVIRGALIKL